MFYACWTLNLDGFSSVPYVPIRAPILLRIPSDGSDVKWQETD
jgi:hypothetical protein